MKFNTFEDLITHGKTLGISGDYFNWWNYSERGYHFYEIYYTDGHTLKITFESKPQQDQGFESVMVQLIYPQN